MNMVDRKLAEMGGFGKRIDFLRIAPSIAVVLWAVLLFGNLLVAASLCGWHIVYTLDDPYIHLAVAERILQGDYGINVGEFSSPSSSILYPFLLSGFLALGFGQFGPLVLNCAATGVGVWLLASLYWEKILKSETRSPWQAAMLFVLLMACLNVFALPLSGMEHSLHILAVLMTLCGLLSTAETGKVNASLIAGCIALPFIRFEGLALAGATILGLLALRQRITAGLIFGAIVLGLGIWATFMARLGLPTMPSSVLSKSDLVAATGIGAIVLRLANQFRESINNNHFGLLFACCACLLLGRLQASNGEWKINTPRGVVAFVVSLSLIAHLFAGGYGWFNRYEVYAVAMLVFGILVVYSEFFQKTFWGSRKSSQYACIAAAALLCGPYVWGTFKVPKASRNIYEQQFQMHRFAVEFLPRRVAVNDLGLASYGNDQFVLDLSGLGSETVRKLRHEGSFTTNEMTELTRQHEIAYAMLYPDLNPKVPDTWCLMGILRTEKFTAYSGDVYFYRLPKISEFDMRQALQAFSPTLPSGARLEQIDGCRERGNAA